MDVKNTHSVTKTEISVFGRQALDAERRRSPSLAEKVLRLLKELITQFVLLKYPLVLVYYEMKNNFNPSCTCIVYFVMLSFSN